MGLDREAEQAARREHARDCGGDRDKVGQVDEDVGADDEVEGASGRMLALEKAVDLADVETVVEVFFSACATMPADRSTPVRCATRDESAPQSPVPQPRSSSEAKRAGRPMLAHAASTAARSSAGPR